MSARLSGCLRECWTAAKLGFGLLEESAIDGGEREREFLSSVGAAASHLQPITCFLIRDYPPPHPPPPTKRIKKSFQPANEKTELVVNLLTFTSTLPGTSALKST